MPASALPQATAWRIAHKPEGEHHDRECGVRWRHEPSRVEVCDAHLQQHPDMSIDDVTLLEARERVTALRAWLQRGNRQPVRLVETHMSRVLLTDTLAFKLKKPVRLPFLDFSTLAARRHYCEEELRLNWRLAPSIYLDVVDIREGPCIEGCQATCQTDPVTT